MKAIYATQVKKKEVIGKIDINGINIIKMSDKEEIFEQINFWIFPGLNKLQINLDWPVSKQFKEGYSQFSLNIFQGESGKLLSEAKSILTYNWPQKDVEEVYPKEILLSFDVKYVPLTNFWRLSKPIILNDKMIEKVIKFVCNVHQHFENKELSELLNIFDFKALDIGNLMYFSNKKARDSQKDFFEFVMDTPNWSMKPINLEQIEYTLFANNRLLLISANGYEPIIQSNPSNGPKLILQIYLALINDELTIVR